MPDTPRRRLKPLALLCWSLAAAAFDAALRALLCDEDLRRRGLAAYGAVHRWKDASPTHDSKS